MEDIAYELIEDTYCMNELPLIISNNINYRSIARDLEYEGNYHLIGSEIFEYRG